MDVRVRTEPRGERCPICHAEDMSDKPIIRCGACGTVTHAECHTSNGGCATIGCDRSRQPTKNMAAKTDIASRPTPSCKYNIEGCTSVHGDEYDLDRIGSSLRSQLPLLGTVLLVPAAVMFLVWLLFQIIRPAFEGRYLPSMVGVITFIFVFWLKRRLRTRPERQRFGTLLLLFCPYILFVLLIWLAAR